MLFRTRVRTVHYIGKGGVGSYPLVKDGEEGTPHWDGWCDDVGSRQRGVGERHRDGDRRSVSVPSKPNIARGRNMPECTG